MKRKIFAVLLLILCLAGRMSADAAGDMFAKAKVLIFDKQWAAALEQLDELIEKFPAGRHYATALFYRGKCQEELGARKQALDSYEKFVRSPGGGNLVEEAQISIIDLAAGLYQAGEKNYLQKMLERLGHENKVVSYYSAFKLSYLPDRKIAARALPVLRAILDGEKDGELRDRARIAVMRIDPSRLAGMDRREKSAAGGMLKIRIYSRVERKEKVSLSIPLGLADLALQALGAEEKRTLQKEGYDLDQILEQLAGKGLKIDIQGDNEVMQIWVD